ncbi:MAG: response regulator [Deltaproteobacteria bacterium]|nr:MAG: response regulator [Deltaproteobacteria bacterium]
MTRSEEKKRGGNGRGGMFQVGPSDHTILVVEDEEMIRELVAERLRLEGFRVLEAENGKAALSILDREKVDLLLTDINMPVMNGIDLLKEVRGAQDLAVIVMSGQGDLEVAVFAMKAGAHDYIMKPVNFKILIHTIESALKRKMMEQALRDYQHNLEQKVAEQTKIINEFYLRSVQSLVKALEAKDEYTRGHSERVTFYSVEISKRLGGAVDVERVRTAGVLHDLGKIGVPESILNKPSRLTDDEFEVVKKHPLLGVKILEPIEFLRGVFPIILHHHERFDGRGYPSGLKGEKIPLEARVIAVADTFDAMTSTRAYRKALSAEEAIAEIKRCSGTQFDPDIARLFIDIYDSLTLPEGVHLPEGISSPRASEKPQITVKEA